MPPHPNFPDLPADLPPRLSSHLVAVEDGCIHWDGPRTGKNLPVIKWEGGRVRSVQRVLRSLTDPEFDLRDPRRFHNTCGNRDCVNPAHHAPGVPRAEHFRGGLCMKGLHDITVPGSVKVSPTGNRRCRACAAEANRRYYSTDKGKAAWRAAQRRHRERVKK